MADVSFAACPACVAAPAAAELARAQPLRTARLCLSLPAIHCAACITGVERTLLRQEGVRAARVNLTLKRVQVDAAAQVTAQTLVQALTRVGFEAYELDPDALAASETDKRGRAILTRIAVAGFAMMNVMLLSVAIWSGAQAATRDMFHWVSAAIALPAVAFAAQPFFGAAWRAVKGGRLNMDVPISLAILLACAMSLFETVQGGEQAYFDAALSLTFFLLAGRYLDFRTRSLARSAAEQLAALEVPRATLQDGRIVPVAEVAPGATVRVVPGARVPVDGVVISGTSEVDRAWLTGESLPALVETGDRVTAGEVNLTGALVLRVTAAGRDSSLHRIADLVALAETARNRYTSLADRAARIYAPLVHLLALLAFVAWFAASRDLRLSLNIAVAVLIITCPCALGLAVPAVVTAASGRLFRAGLLIKSATALERLAEVDTVVFDKTGTLTTGTAQLTNLAAFCADEIGVALALAQGSAHPLSLALSEAARAAGHRAAQVTDIREVAGFGVEGLWRGQTVRLGRAAWAGGAVGQGGTAAWLVIAKAPARAFEFTDELRAGAVELVAGLQAQGKQVVLLSGDSAQAVAQIAARLGIVSWEADCLPQSKAARIAALAASGKRVLMVGDGLNDTAALAGAHVSISPASALEAARVVSDIVLLGRSLAPVAQALEVAVSARRRIKENFAVAVVYNLIAVPVALAGFATPLAAAIAMSSSSVLVSLNAVRLRRAATARRRV